MRHISADYIFPISSDPIKNGIITIDEDGVIQDVNSEFKSQKEEMEYYKGIICPGFINTHCHLELSHLKGQVAERTGMTGFINDFISKRTAFPVEKIHQAINDAEAEMIRNGIVAVGDISNNSNTFKQKAKGDLQYHTFIEIFNQDTDKAEEVFESGKKLVDELINTPLPRSSSRTPSQEGNNKFSYSIVPHAPYTVSEKLLKMIEAYAVENKSIVSIHNQESEGESELFISKNGVMFDAFMKMGLNTDLIRKTGVNSLRSTLPFLRNVPKLLLVHNTFTSKADIKWAFSQISDPKSQVSNLKSQIYFCTCPNANLYIENSLPDYNCFIETNARVTIGTDSLASNWTLSILDELKTITKHYPDIPLETLLLWATKNGAEFLDFPQLGTLEKGKKPGLNLLKNMVGLKISEKTEVVKLI